MPSTRPSNPTDAARTGRDPAGPFALTPRQEMIWVEDALHPGVPANHVLTRLSIGGALDVEAFRRAFASVVAASEALRMRVRRGGARMEAVVDPAPGSAALEWHDLRSETDPAAAAARLLDGVCRAAFGDGDRLHRALLMQLGAAEFLFVLDQHHSITDSQSCLLLHRAIERAYRGEPAEPCGRFTDAMREQLEYGRSDAARDAAAFWTEHLADAADPGRFYGRSPSGKGATTIRVTRELGAATTAALRERRLGAPPSLVFAAALAAWMSRVTESPDVVFGVPLLNRPAEFVATPGLLMEICPNRVQVAETDTFAAVLAKAQAEAAAVRPHRRHPLTSRQARYGVLLNVHPPAIQSFAGMPASYELTTPLNLVPPESFADDASPWDKREALTVQIHRHGDDAPYVVGFDGNARMFGRAAIERGLAHFVALLERCVADPSAAVGAIDLLTPQEKAILFPREETGGAATRTVTQMIARTIATSPDRVALRHRDTTWTYAELADRVDRLAAWFAAAGVRAGDRVGVCLTRSPDMVASLLAVMRAGAAYVPLDPTHPGDRLRLILEDAKPSLLVTDADGAQALGDAAGRTLRLDRDAAPPGVAAQLDAAVPSGVAYVIFTSGSTGRPKGVQVLHHGLAAFLAAMSERPGIAADDRLLALTTVSFDIAALEMFLPLVAGATVVIGDRTEAVDPAAIARRLESDGVTVLQATPATWHMLLQNGWGGRAGMKALVGGEALTGELADALVPRVASLWNMYGPTETTVWSTCARVVAGARPVSIGKPIRGTRAYVLNGLGVPAPLGVAGELHLGGDGVAAGYLDRPDLTSDRFVPDPFAISPGARMYRTGDVVRALDDGSLEYLGRRDFQVKIRGYRIELGEIESVLEAHDDVAQAVVVVRGSGQSDAMLVAYVKPARAGVELSGVEAHARRKLPAYMVPSRIVEVESFPLTPSGKVDRKKLPDVGDAAPAPSARVAWEPRDAFEARLRRLWQTVLGHESFGPEDSFFEVGGHSLLALDLVRRLQDGLGVNLDVGAIFRFPTLRRQAEIAAQGGASATSAVVPLQESGEGTPVYGICGIHLYGELARRLEPRRPFFGVYVPGEQFLQSGAPDAGDTPTAEIAAEYYRRIREHRPHGPFHLLGFCFGGMVAYEVARLAARDGADVRTVVLVDTALWTHLRRRQARRVTNRLRRMFAGSAPQPAPAAAGAPPELVDDRAERLLARSRTYVPSGRFDGRCLLVRGSEGDLFDTWKTTPMLGWEPYFGDGSGVVTVPGAHDTILHPPVVDQVAAELGRVL